MTLIDRVRSAWKALCAGDDDGIYTNWGHRYAIVIGENGFLADQYLIDSYSGNPEWTVSVNGNKIKCKKFDGWVLKEFLLNSKR